MTNPSSSIEQANVASFPDHTPSNDVEARLIELQNEADELGLALFRKLLFNTSGDSEITHRLSLAAEEAGKLLADNPLDHQDGGFSVRYVYEAQKEPDTFPKIIYPADSLHFSAYIEGEVGEVNPMVVEHPAMDRKGVLGYRLCAEADATRVMGWYGREPRKFYLPVGEIQLEEVPYEQGMAERMEPAAERRFG